MRLTIYITLGITLFLGATASKTTHLRRTKRMISTEDIVNIVATIIDVWELIDKKVADNELNFEKFGNLSGKVDLSFLNRKQALLMDGINGVSTVYFNH